MSRGLNFTCDIFPQRVTMFFNLNDKRYVRLKRSHRNVYIIFNAEMFYLCSTE